MRFGFALLCAMAGWCVVAGVPSAVWANGRYPAAGQLVVDPADSSHIVVRATFGLLQSFDAASTWSWIYEEAVNPGGFQDPEISLTTGGRIDVGLPDGLAVGERSGCQWTRVPNSANDNVIDLVARAGDAATVYALAEVTVNGAFNGLVAGTTDGVSWALDGDLLPDMYPLRSKSPPPGPSGCTWAQRTATSRPASSTSLTTAARVGPCTTVPPASIPSTSARPIPRTRIGGTCDRTSLRASLYVTEDGAKTWSLIYESDVPLIGFALSPDGQQIAVGGTNGITILTRATGDGGSAFAVTTTSPLSVTCLTWTASGLFACADEATSGFTIGVSTDRGRMFAPLLHLKDLTPVSCPADTLAMSCAAQWCSTATTIGAPCAVQADAALDAKGDGTRAVATQIAGCACDTADSTRMPGNSSRLCVDDIARPPKIAGRSDYHLQRDEARKIYAYRLER